MSVWIKEKIHKSTMARWRHAGGGASRRKGCCSNAHLIKAFKKNSTDPIYLRLRSIHHFLLFFPVNGGGVYSTCCWMKKLKLLIDFKLCCISYGFPFRFEPASGSSDSQIPHGVIYEEFYRPEKCNAMIAFPDRVGFQDFSWQLNKIACLFCLLLQTVNLCKSVLE